MTILNSKDRKLLLELDLNARQSLSELGRRTGMSKEVVNYRIRRLQEEGIIKGFFAKIDSSKLGVTIFRTFLRLYNLTPEKDKEIIEFIVSNPRVGWCVKVYGNYDLNFIYWASGTNDFSLFMNGLTEKFGNFIEHKWVSVFDIYQQFPKLYLGDEKNAKFDVFTCGRGKKIDFDKKDIEMLAIISSNARISLVELAKRIGASDKFASYRLKNLVEQKVIQGYGVHIDLDKIGYSYFKLHIYFKNFSEKRFKDLLNYCSLQKNIIYTNRLIGGADLELDIHVKGKEEYEGLLNEIRYKFFDIIRDFETLQYSAELKMNLFPRL